MVKQESELSDDLQAIPLTPISAIAKMAEEHIEPPTLPNKPIGRLSFNLMRVISFQGLPFQGDQCLAR